MSNYVNIENYCRSCVSLEDDDYSNIKKYYKESFQTNTKGKLIVNPSKPGDFTPSVKEKFNRRQQFEREGVL